MPLKVLQDYILVRPLERKASSVIEVVLLHELPNLGIVVAVGPGKADKKGRVRPLEVRVGDTVRFGEFRAMFPEWRETPEGPRYLILQENDVAGVVMAADEVAALNAIAECLL